MKTEEIEKKEEEKLDLSISNHDTRFLNFLKFIAFTILVTFKYFVITPIALILCHHIKKGVLRNFAKFTRQYLSWSVFFNKVASLHPAASLKQILRQ